MYSLHKTIRERAARPAKIFCSPRFMHNTESTTRPFILVLRTPGILRPAILKCPSDGDARRRTTMLRAARARGRRY
jgi:hypothetical protein